MTEATLSPETHMNRYQCKECGGSGFQGGLPHRGGYYIVCLRCKRRLKGGDLEELERDFNGKASDPGPFDTVWGVVESDLFRRSCS